MRLEEIAQTQARSQPPIFFRQVLKMVIAAVKVIGYPLTTKLVRAKLLLKFECFANVFVALNFVTLLDFSEQAFILETVMRSWLGE